MEVIRAKEPLSESLKTQKHVTCASVFNSEIRNNNKKWQYSIDQSTYLDTLKKLKQKKL